MDVLNVKILANQIRVVMEQFATLPEIHHAFALQALSEIHLKVVLSLKSLHYVVLDLADRTPIAMLRTTKNSVSADQDLSEILTRVVESNRLVLAYQILAALVLNALLHQMETQCVAAQMEWEVILQDLADVMDMNVW